MSRNIPAIVGCLCDKAAVLDAPIRESFRHLYHQKKMPVFNGLKRIDFLICSYLNRKRRIHQAYLRKWLTSKVRDMWVNFSQTFRKSCMWYYNTFLVQLTMKFM